MLSNAEAMTELCLKLTKQTLVKRLGNKSHAVAFRLKHSGRQFTYSGA